MGVMSVHCPRGLIDKWIWTNALEKYKNNKKSAYAIVESDGSVTEIKSDEQYTGIIKMVNMKKRFGFIQYGNSKTKDIFFHFSSLPGGCNNVEEGDELSFTIDHDTKNGKSAANKIELISQRPQDTVNMRAFSMNLPFAALLANGYKTLETRNGTMFTTYPEGTKMLLHVGQRLYPDGERHIDVMKSGDLTDDEIKDLKFLPKGFEKGMAVAIVELGKTYETTLKDRCNPDFQRKVGAFGEDSGMRATEIKRVAYLKKGAWVSGKGGVFKVDVDRDVIPDGWL
uniref:CSD domain-containing protein n=1 Tax=Eucampia antarctica TaxID=49252 RepID=A0A7S2W2Q9_9STRA|mmetsp:Transcript_18070/g.17428  ORF Transcript_18070/g.17428 Transcript_18070/m.17428 type:complete len:283 (+) Transcript_18070:613-1461(+)